MLISDFSIRRPVVSIVASLLLVVFGAYSLMEMPVRETPNIDRPMIGITFDYVGAAADVVESKVVKIIEDQVSGVAGLIRIGCQARDGTGFVNLEFDMDRDIEDAANDVRDQMSRVMARLPDDMEPPVVAKADPDSEPIMFFNLSSDRHDLMELTDYAIHKIQPRIGSLPGVASMNVFSARQKSMRIWLDRRAMAARDLTVADVEAALRRENVEMGAGMAESVDRNISLRTLRSYQKPEDFARMVITRGANNYLVRLGEIARVEVAPVDVFSITRANDRPGIGAGVIKQPGASTLDVANAVRAEMEEIRKILPPGVEFVINVDSSNFIAGALHEVSIAMGVAAVLVMLVIYLFLGTIRAAIIPAVTVPISLIATFIVLWPAGFSVNILTLLAMVLAIGLVVDDAIIMLENIHRRMHMGEPAPLAALRGARQVGMAVVATTMVLAAAFMPVALLRGQVGSLFKEFAVTMTVAVLASLFISLTLTPVMCSKILTLSMDNSKVSRWSNRTFDRLKNFYARMLNRALDRPRVVMSLFAAFVALSGVLFTMLPQEFTPKEDRGFFNIQMRAPEGATTAYMDRQMKAVADLLRPYRERGEIVRVMENGGAENQARLFVVLPPWDDPKHRSSLDMVRELEPKFAAITGAQVVTSLPGSLGMGGGGNQGGYVVSISGDTFEELRVIRDKMMEDLVKSPLFMQVRSNFVETKPQVRIRVDGARAGDLGVSVSTIGNTMATMVGSRKVTTYVDKGEEYDVYLQGDVEDRRTPTDISNLYVRSDITKQLIPLSSVVTFEEGTSAMRLNRVNRNRVTSFNLFPKPDTRLGDMIAEFEAMAAIHKSPGSAVNWIGEAGDFKRNSSAIYISFALALIIVFLVLAAQFESFIHPFVIMMTVPLAITGALIGLVVAGQSINLYSQIGIIVLVGLAAKNGILIVEFANQLRDSGREFREALVEASLIRLRPIIMTALATVMGALPLVFSSGAGAEGRRPIGIVIAAGVTLSTIITLVVVPVFYQLLAKRTSSPGRMAAELKEYERRHPIGATPEHQPGE